MSLRPLRLSVLFTLVAAMVAVLAPTASASPDGDDDPAYKPGSAFGTTYSPLAENRDLAGAKPVADQAPDGSSVTAVLIDSSDSKSSTPYLLLTRFGLAGQELAQSESELTDDFSYTELLDLRVLADGSFVVLIRGRTNFRSDNETLFVRRFGANLAATGDQSYGRPLPECADDIITRGDNDQYMGLIEAARVGADGQVYGLWDCVENEDTWSGSARGGFGDDRDTYVTRYGAGDAIDSHTRPIADVDYGEDLELGPGGDVYTLSARFPSFDRAFEAGSSLVHRFAGADLTPSTSNPSTPIDGNPVDLAVNGQSRPVVWTQTDEDVLDERGAGAPETWTIWRLQPGLAGLDGQWGSGGKTTITEPRLGFAYGENLGRTNKRFFLTVRPGDKVLALGGYRPQEQNPNRALDSSDNGIMAGLTSGGQLDTGFATGGFKVFEYPNPATPSRGGLASNGFDRIGEPTLQSDGKILVPHTDRVFIRQPEPPGEELPERIAAPPAQSGEYVGVTRLIPAPPGAAPAGNPPAASPVRPSAAPPTICGRRAISLVRADVQGKRVKLTGLVGAALYGKTVTIQTDPKGAKSSKFTKTTTVKASRTGAFTAFVKRPAKSDFVSVRYRAVSGSAKSPVLKLPQRLTSRSVKSAAGTITVKGRVKKSVLGKRNKVKIRRLVCGRYRTVGSAKPDANGNYTVKFDATQIRGVAFYRAESMVLRKAGSKTYVIQYARAIAIRTTSHPG